MKRYADKLVGTIVTLFVCLLSFLTFSYFGSFETIASSESKYAKLDRKITMVLCLLDQQYCANEVKK